MRVLITGGAGFIGSHLSDLYIARGDEVFCIDDLSTGSIDNIAHLKGNARYHYTIDTVHNQPVVAELIDQCDVVFHLAAAVGVGQSMYEIVSYTQTNELGTAVLLEALACGTPVAAFPVTGPLDVIADHQIGALSDDLREACLRALGMSREACRNFAMERSWENSARQFIGNLSALQPSRALRPSRPIAARTAVRG